MLVLELFPGGSLWGSAFEAEMNNLCIPTTVVRGPDILYGHSIEGWHVQPGVFDGIIGGPPCQLFSKANWSDKGVNLIPEYLRIFEEAKPKWAIMENVPDALEAGPDWPVTKIRDWDVGGTTYRTRLFWWYGIPAPELPETRPGTPQYSVLASSWKNRGKDTEVGYNRHTYPQRSVEEAEALQGFYGFAENTFRALPSGMTKRQKEIFTIHLLGNGVPRAMGRWTAKQVYFYLAYQGANNGTEAVQSGLDAGLRV